MTDIILIVLFDSFFPRLARNSNTTVWGLEVDAGDTVSVVWRKGPGPFLPGAAVLSQWAAARSATRYIGVPPDPLIIRDQQLSPPSEIPAVVGAVLQITLSFTN